MQKLLILIFLVVNLSHADAQSGNKLHQGKFNKRKMFMSSNQYRPDDWEKPYFDRAIKTVFPSDLNKFPEKYKGKFIHLIGVVDSVFMDTGTDSNIVTFVLENKYWDYIEDYSIQDEVMFVSPKGDGKFVATLANINPDEIETIKTFSTKKKLLLVYGSYKETVNNFPVVAAEQIKYIDYELYTMNVYSYEVKRDNEGEVQTDKKGKVQLTNFHFFTVPKAGQNK